MGLEGEFSGVIHGNLRERKREREREGEKMKRMGFKEKKKKKPLNDSDLLG